ncbi:ribonuclease domain-containing protein [Corynebacterium uterequi]|nr:ribonuclease domain-containing protein [Corynebacterium uterequi]
MAASKPSPKAWSAGIGGVLTLAAAAFFVLFPDSGTTTPDDAPPSSTVSTRAAASSTASSARAAAGSTASSARSAAGSTAPSARSAAGSTAASGLSACPLDTLPDEALETVDDILAGGPYEFPNNDNTRFGNYESILPDEDRSYYREYTVVTPGLDHRGARRIVTGGGSETDPDVWYYTDDHYESFCEIPDAHLL